MTTLQKVRGMNSEEILNSTKEWFTETIVLNHIRNTKKCSNPAELKINPFTVGYLANFLEGKATATSLAKALIYPRVLGTSISTSFGQNLQSFITRALGAFGSTTAGIDIEFIDKIDGRKKYGQLKAGPQTINKDDVITIHNHYRNVRNLARTNGVSIADGDLIIGILYGERNQLNAHYKNLEKQYFHHVFIGQEFWLRLTGENNFYDRLIKILRDVAIEFDGREIMEKAISDLSKSEEIKNLLKHLV